MKSDGAAGRRILGPSHLGAKTPSPERVKRLLEKKKAKHGIRANSHHQRLREDAKD